MRATFEQYDPEDERSAVKHSGETSQSATPASEEIHIRNFDVSRAYDLTIEVRDDRELVFANRYHLTPGKTESERGRLPPGEYQIRVELDGRRLKTVRAEVGESLEKTVLVEVGNGTLSITEGLYR